MKRGRQHIPREKIDLAISIYPQFEKYLEQAGREDNGQASAPDEQAEQFKQIIESLKQIVEEYAGEKATLEERNAALEQEYKAMRDKYIALLEDLRK